MTATAPSAEPERAETDVILPDPSQVTLSTGDTVNVLPLKARQFFKLLRILTRGAAFMVSRIDFKGLDTDGLATQLMAAAVFAIPEAPDAVFDFLISIVDVPHDTKGQYTEVGQRVYNCLADPEIVDVVDVIEAVVNLNKDDLTALGKRLGALLQVAKATGQLEETPPTAQPGSSARTAGSSTSSPPSTDGATTRSSTSPSDGSARSSVRLVTDDVLTTSASGPT